MAAYQHARPWQQHCQECDEEEEEEAEAEEEDEEE